MILVLALSIMLGVQGPHPCGSCLQQYQCTLKLQLPTFTIRISITLCTICGTVSVTASMGDSPDLASSILDLKSPQDHKSQA